MNTNRKAFLALLYKRLLEIGYFETKAKKVKFISPLTQEQFYKQYGPLIKRLFKQLWRQNLDLVTEKRVTEAMRGIDHTLLDQVTRNYETWGKTIYNPGMSKIIGLGGQTVTDAINSLADAEMFFDVTHPSVVDWLTNHTATEIVGPLLKNQGAAIREVIRASLANNYNFQQTKSLLEHGMVLTERGTTWVNNFYQKAYDERLKRYVLDGLPNPAIRAHEAAEKLKKVHQSNLLKNRQERIARTETNRARNVAEQAGIMQAEDAGKIRNPRKTWRRTSSVDNWPSSITNDGVTVGLRDRFPSGHEFPNEINEQCYVEHDFEIIKEPGRPGKPIARVPGVSKPKPKPKPKPKIEKPKFIKAKSIKEAEQYAIDNFGLSKINYSRFDLDKANTINKVVNKYMNEYPQLKGKLKYIGDIEQFSKYALDQGVYADAFALRKSAQSTTWAAYAKDSKGIGFLNNNLLKQQALVNKHMIASYKKGWSSYLSGNAFEGTVEHEFTHFMDDIFNFRGNKNIKNIWDKYTAIEIEKGLGKYSTSNIGEFIAEGWAEYVLSPKPRKISLEIGKAIEKILKVQK